MSTNCIHCVANERSGNDLLCDKCRAMTTTDKPYKVVVKYGATRPVCLKVGCQEFALAYDPGDSEKGRKMARWTAGLLRTAMGVVYEAGRTVGKAAASNTVRELRAENAEQQRIIEILEAMHPD